MSIKLNVNRTTTIAVPIEVDGEIQSFQATCNILKKPKTIKKAKKEKEKLLIEEILVSVEGLELCDDTGRVLTQEETVSAVLRDYELSACIIQAWTLGNEKKLTNAKTFLQQQNDC